MERQRSSHNLEQTDSYFQEQTSENQSLNPKTENKTEQQEAKPELSPEPKKWDGNDDGKKKFLTD